MTSTIPGRNQHVKVRTAKSLLLIAAALPGLFAAGCSSGSNSMTSFSSGLTAQDRPKLFTVPADQMTHVHVVTVEPSTVDRVLRLTGSVAYNGFHTTPVISQISGPVGRILVEPGQFVHRGQPMLYVSSPDFSQMRANYVKARDAHTLATTQYERAKDLYAHHAVSLSDLQAAESAEVQAQADLDAAQQSLQVLGIPKPDTLTKGPSSPEVAVLAPISGEVVERLVAPGQLLQGGGTQCFTISDMSSVWVLANVFQNDLGQVHVGDPVTIDTDAYATKFHGKISYIGAALDPNTRTVQARIVTDNPGEKLKNNMYVTAEVRAGKATNVIAVPDSSVLRTADNQPFVYLEQGSGKFGEQLVSIGETQGGKTVILSGLKPGDRVAAEGSLFLQFQNSLQQNQ